MKKIEEVEVPEKVFPSHKERVAKLYCDKCGEEILESCNGTLRIRSYYDSDIYKERKYKYYKGFDFCSECVESFLLPILCKELDKETNDYEVELKYE